MGKGDRKTRRGKIYRGSHGNARPHTAAAPAVAGTTPAVHKTATATKRAPRKTAPRKKAT